MKEMSGEGNLHICLFMVLYLEDMKRIKALVENLNWGFLEMKTASVGKTLDKLFALNQTEIFHLWKQIQKPPGHLFTLVC